MKTIDNSFISSTALQPFKKGTWSHLQSAYQEVIEAIMRGQAAGLGTPSSSVYVIYGCLVTISGGNYTVSAGAVYYNGKVYLMDAKGSTAVPSGGNTYVCKIKDTYYTDATADPVEFTDGNTHNVHKIEKVEIEAGTSGSGIANYADFIGIPMATGAYLSTGSWSGTYVFDFQINRNIYFSGSSSPVFDFNLSNAKIGTKQRAFVELNNGETIGGSTTADHQIVLPKAGTCTLYHLSSSAVSITATQQYVIELEYLGVLNGTQRVLVTIYGL